MCRHIINQLIYNCSTDYVTTTSVMITAIDVSLWLAQIVYHSCNRVSLNDPVNRVSDLHNSPTASHDTLLIVVGFGKHRSEFPSSNTWVDRSIVTRRETHWCDSRWQRNRRQNKAYLISLELYTPPQCQGHPPSAPSPPPPVCPPNEQLNYRSVGALLWPPPSASREQNRACFIASDEPSKKKRLELNYSVLFTSGSITWGYFPRLKSGGYKKPVSFILHSMVPGVVYKTTRWICRGITKRKRFSRGGVNICQSTRFTTENIIKQSAGHPEFSLPCVVKMLFAH